MKKEYYFQMEGLTVGYHGKPVIRNINIRITQGQIVTLIGPNGAGKSTILKSITRQLERIGGHVYVQEKDIGELSYREISTRMAVVLTERVHPEMMTCHDVVATGRYPYTGRLGVLTAEDEQKVDAAMRVVNAEDLGACDFNAISDGQRQRILLARAICQEPDIIVLDEPTSFLDVRHKLDLLSILHRMAHEQNITVIMSLHEIDLAMKISDRICCVKDGLIQHYGKPEDIFNEKIIRDLYDIDNGFFDPMFGSIELPAPTGDAKILVVSSGGTGVPVYRQLQREGRPFIAGILYTNDVDYRLARLLAADVIAEKPFTSIRQETLTKALQTVERVDEVIDAGITIGECNAAMQQVLDLAKQEGKLIHVNMHL